MHGTSQLVLFVSVGVPRAVPSTITFEEVKRMSQQSVFPMRIRNRKDNLKHNVEESVNVVLTCLFRGGSTNRVRESLSRTSLVALTNQKLTLSSEIAHTLYGVWRQYFNHGPAGRSIVRRECCQ